MKLFSKCRYQFTFSGTSANTAVLPLFLLLNLPLASSTAQAAEPDSLRTVELQDVQVVSTRATSRTPMSYSEMTKEQIKQTNFGKDIPSILLLTPSVTTTSDAGNGIGYTSFRVRGTDPSRINITANGIPLNDAESATVFFVNMADFASSVQSMQIQRGVGTSTNGAGAFGATLNMQTENIGTKPYIGIDLSGGSYYSHKETLRFGTGLLAGHWGLQGRLSNIGSKGYIDRAETRLNSYFLQAGYFGDNTVVKFITFNGTEQTYHAWNYTSKYEQALYGRTYNSCGVMGYDSEGNPNKYYSSQTDNYHQQNYQLLWNQIFTPSLSMNVGLHFTKGQGYYEQYQAEVQWKKFGMSTDPDIWNDLVDQQKMDNNFYGVVASLNYNDHSRLQATLGGGWNRYNGDQFGHIVWTMPGIITSQPTPEALTPDFEYYRNHSRKTDFNIYGKLNYQLVGGLSAFVDMQYRRVGYALQNPTVAYGANADGRYVADNTYNFFNPKFGLNYDFDHHHRVYASYGIGHKEPVRNNFMQQIANPDDPAAIAKAERLNDLEVGYRLQSQRFTAGLNFYWMNYKNQLVLTGELNQIGEALTRNLKGSYRLGVELEAGWQPADWFRWDLNATFSRNRVKDIYVTLDDANATKVNLGTQPLSFSPDIILNNIFTFSYKGFKAAVQGQYLSKQYMTNTGFETLTGWDAQGNETSETLMLGGRFTCNIDISYRFTLARCGLKDASIGLMLYNIFNTKYDTNGWAAPAYTQKDGQVRAYNPNYSSYAALRDMWAVGFAPAAPFHLMGHLSINF